MNLNKKLIQTLCGCLVLTALSVYIYIVEYSGVSFFRYAASNLTNIRVNAVINKSSHVDFGLVDEVTVVTAYFNIGKFPKGSTSNQFTPDLYRRWMLVFSLITNPTVMYVDNDDDYKYMQAIRSGLPPNRTMLIKLARPDMWSFKLEKNISKIYHQPGYPKHHPNTVVPAYSAAMHAKYEVVRLTAQQNPFHTKYFCWLDIGLFRDLTNRGNRSNPGAKIGEEFSLYLPPDFHNDSVAVCEIYNRNNQATVREIVYHNMVWLGGGFFFAEKEVMLNWTMEYINAVEVMMRLGYMSTDQQVLYSMFNTMHPQTKVQTYRSDGRYNDWFHLGYVAREEGKRRNVTRIN